MGLLERALGLVKQYRSKMDNSNSVACIPAAETLRMRAGGEVYFVPSIDPMDPDTSVFHAYVVPENADDDTTSLNAFDNGYGDFPPLTNGMVKKFGKKAKRDNGKLVGFE